MMINRRMSKNFPQRRTMNDTGSEKKVSDNIQLHIIHNAYILQFFTTVDKTIKELKDIVRLNFPNIENFELLLHMNNLVLKENLAIKDIVKKGTSSLLLKIFTHTSINHHLISNTMRDEDEEGDDQNNDEDEGDEEYTPSSSINMNTILNNYRSGVQQQNYNSKSNTGYTGLSNQGATCYLNSLCQSLFMTPEFRQAIYHWSFEDYCRKEFKDKLKENKDKKEKTENENNEKNKTENTEHNVKDKTENTEHIEQQDTVKHDHDHDHEEDDIEKKYQKFRLKKEENSIPRQLQKLFVNLQLTEDRAIETTDLTTSFGWTEEEAFTQHDVQELCRVLFDALEGVWRGTDRENFINEMYQGEMKDYVRCLECGHESSRNDKFLDIPLVIKGFGETKAISSILEALSKFIENEKLEKDNQYFCEKCN